MDTKCHVISTDVGLTCNAIGGGVGLIWWGGIGGRGVASRERVELPSIQYNGDR